jgi:hypothetical protein
MQTYAANQKDLTIQIGATISTKPDTKHYAMKTRVNLIKLQRIGGQNKNVTKALHIVIHEVHENFSISILTANKQYGYKQL